MLKALRVLIPILFICGCTTHNKYIKLKNAIKTFEADTEYLTIKRNIETIAADSLRTALLAADSAHADPYLTHINDSIFGLHPKLTMKVGFVIFNAAKDTCIVGIGFDAYDKRLMSVALVPAIKSGNVWVYGFPNSFPGYLSKTRSFGFEYKPGGGGEMFDDLMSKSIYDLVSCRLYNNIGDIYYNDLVNRIVDKP